MEIKIHLFYCFIRGTLGTAASGKGLSTSAFHGRYHPIQYWRSLTRCRWNSYMLLCHIISRSVMGCDLPAEIASQNLGTSALNSLIRFRSIRKPISPIYVSIYVKQFQSANESHLALRSTLITQTESPRQPSSILPMSNRHHP